MNLLQPSLAEQVMSRLQLDHILSGIEKTAFSTPLGDGDVKQVAIARLLGRLDTMRGLMELVITQQIEKYPERRAEGLESIQTLNRRIEDIRSRIAANKPPDADPAARARSAALEVGGRLYAHIEAVTEYVSQIHTMDLSVPQIDSQIADLIRPLPDDMGSFRTQAEELLARAVYELVKLRFATLERQTEFGPDIPSLAYLQATAALRSSGLTPAQAHQTIGAIQRGEIPHVGLAA